MQTTFIIISGFCVVQSYRKPLVQYFSILQCVILVVNITIDSLLSGTYRQNDKEREFCYTNKSQVRSIECNIAESNRYKRTNDSLTRPRVKLCPRVLRPPREINLAFAGRYYPRRERSDKTRKTTIATLLYSPVEK